MPYSLTDQSSKGQPFMSHVLAYDLGGSSLRLAIVDDAGDFLASVRKPLKISSDGRASFETDPADWWAAIRAGCADLISQGADLTKVTAIAGCGFTRSQVFLDADNAVLRPAITFQDSRAAALLDELREDPALQPLIAGLGPYDPLARLLWVRAHEPETWARLRRVLEPKDYLTLMLTGEAASDSISQTPMTRILAANEGILGQLDIDADILPLTLSPFAEVGRVLPDLPAPLTRLAGVPVYNGSIDTWACVLGSGALTPGVAYSISGTSDVSGVIASTRHSAVGLLTVDWGPNIWQLGGPSQGAATRLNWALDRFFPRAARHTALASALGTRRPVPLFLPYLDGERTPFWDAELRGAFLGLGSAHDGPDFLRAVAEGMNYLSRDILDRAETAIGTPVSHVCFSGGLATTPALCQLKADVLNRPVLVPKNHETGLMGAARLAQGRTCGCQPPASRRYDPDPLRRAYHDERFALFRQASEALRPLSHALARQDG
ncbi:xylulokinase [Seohaeicola zhoushanensis]|uniref:Xylulokinase n=2 Tax=Seohaeicola zhoushanensis TaxID=1569283 RepID=A0A8J3GW51_9RHOB|nr:xylulokinase [Seohaeicola zhoushanensis]